MASSILDDVRAAIAAATEDTIETMVVPLVSNVRVRYNCSIDFDRLKAWTKRATSKGRNAEVDEFKFSCLVLANTCVGIEAKNKETGEFELLLDGAGNAMTYSSPTFQEMTGSMGGALDTVKRLYVNDGHVITVARFIIEIAGYGDSSILGGDDDPLA